MVGSYMYKADHHVFAEEESVNQDHTNDKTESFADKLRGKTKTEVVTPMNKISKGGAVQNEGGS